MRPDWNDAITRGDTARARELLAAGADLDARDRYGQTALMRAAHAGQGELVALLVERGAALDVTAKYGLSALMLAIVAGHAAIALHLVAAGADRRLRGSGAPGFAGLTARDLAAARGMDAVLAALDAAEGSAR